MTLKSKLTIPIKCPGCGRETKKSIQELERSRVVHCTCGAEITVGGDLSKISGSLGKLDDAFARLGKIR